MSQAPYFWPDPSKPGGLPYIRRDGERNGDRQNQQPWREGSDGICRGNAGIGLLLQR